jgi:hypothetical protein
MLQFRLNAFTQLQQRLYDALIFRRRTATRNAHQVESRKVALQASKRFTNQSPPTISHYRLSRRAGHRQPQPGPAQAISSAIQDEHIIRGRRSGRKDPVKFAAAQKPNIPAESLIGHKSWDSTFVSFDDASNGTVAFVGLFGSDIVGITRLGGFVAGCLPIRLNLLLDG